MHENEISKLVLDEAFIIHRAIGPGLLETVYQKLLKRRLEAVGLHVESQVGMPVEVDGVRFDLGFRADLLVENKVIVELKSARQNSAFHFKQTATYVKLSGVRLGLLLNFGLERMVDGIKRVANGIDDDHPVTR